MNREEKSQVVQDIKAHLTSDSAAFLVGYKGLDVAKVTQLRRTLHAKGGSFQVAKVSLIKRAIDEVPALQELRPYLKEQIALVFAPQESPQIAKILQQFAKENEKLQLIGGCVDNKVVGKNAVIVLASLPPKEVLLAQLCGLLQSPITRFAGVLSMLTVRLLVVLKEIEQKKAAAQ
jgi:large subunit ribosomal protein L10